MLNIPNDNMIDIMFNLTLQDLYSISQVTKYHSQLFNDEYLWHKIYFSYFGGNDKYPFKTAVTNICLIVRNMDKKSKLQWAIKNHHVSLFKRIMSDSITINPNKELSYLYLACKYGSYNIVKYLLSQNSKYHKGVENISPLYVSAEKGYLDIVKLLVEHGYDINYSFKNKFTPIIVASQNNHLEIVKYLYNNGAIIFGGKPTCTPLYIASKKNHFEIVKFLSDKS